ncbi:YutD family protein [Paenibacillus sp. S-38]|uniref:YutD family protein n=1 Tax=Paenibacillus sp. S-38 TaxID=3416710 RepID=UPI003CE73C17
MIHIAGKSYEVIVDHKNGWRFEAFRERYSEVLERYDYIVGDWGYSQLRLRGFFKDNHPKATRDTTISTLQDYLNEYCNFGCAYFIIEKVASKQLGPGESYPEGIYDDSAPVPVPAAEGEAAERPAAAAGTEPGRGSEAPAAAGAAPYRQGYQPNRHGPQNRERSHGGRQGGDHQGGGRGRQGGGRGGEGRQGRPHGGHHGSGPKGQQGGESRGHQGGKPGRGSSQGGGHSPKPKSESSRANV